MSVKCLQCNAENPDTKQFCGDCGTPLDADIGPTKTIEIPIEELKRGSVFAGRYEIIEELGKGGMGRVYRVEDTKTKEEIALKLIKPDIAADRKTIERFRNELTTARKIAHRNVCRMFDLGEEKGQHYITMEYVSGGDLKKFIRRSGQMGIGKAISIAKQICDGLEEAHSLGVVHRDLKPNNIMVDDNGNARIMDFGIARTVKGKGITGSGVMIGTPEYMSPEQAEAKDIDQRSDIYSLGVILYEMTTGRLPFEADSPLSVAMKHKNEIPIGPKELNPQIPDDLSEVILKCLEKEKENRFQSANEVRSELEKTEQGFPTTDKVIPKRTPLTSKEITVKFNLKKTIIPGLAVLVIVAVVLVSIFTSGPKILSNRIVVAPFANKTGNPTHDPIGYVVSDWIIQGLTKTGLISVAQVPSGEDAPGTPAFEETVQSLAKEIRAGMIISGTYYQQGENLQFHAQLYDLKKKEIARALDPVTGSIANPMEPIESLRQQLMAALATIQDPLFSGFSESPKPANYEAYKEMVLGNKAFMKYEFEEAIKHFLQANTLDQNFIFPLIAALHAYGNLYKHSEVQALVEKIENSNQELTPIERLMLDARKANLQGDLPAILRYNRQIAKLTPLPGFQFNWGKAAIENNYLHEAISVLENIDPEGIMMRGWVDYWRRLTQAYHLLGKHKKELKAARQGRKQYPDSLYALRYEANALAALGRIDELNELLDESLTLPQIEWHGTMLYEISDELRAHGYRKEAFNLLDRASEWFEENLKEEKTSEPYRIAQAYIHYRSERWDEAQTHFERLYQEFPDRWWYLETLGYLAARKGNVEDALRISEELKDLDVPFIWGGNTYARASIASLLGKKEQAVSLLREAISQGVRYPELHANMNLEPLLHYPPYKELIKPKK